MESGAHRGNLFEFFLNASPLDSGIAKRQGQLIREKALLSLDLVDIGPSFLPTPSRSPAQAQPEINIIYPLKNEDVEK